MSETRGLPAIAAYPLPQEADIPPSRAPWRIETPRAALLIHDMQAYFIAPFQPDASPINPAINNLARLAAHCRARGIPVFYTAQKGNQERRARGLQADLWGPGMRAIPEHEAIVAPLMPQDGDIRLLKHRYSAFQRSDFEQQLQRLGRDQLIVGGIYAHIGCMLTAAEAFQRDIQPFFAADALADFSREKHDLAVRYVAERCGVSRSTRQLLEALA